MAGTLTVSRSSSGVAVQDFLTDSEKGLNHGSITSNSKTLEEVLYIRHDGINPITDLAVYIENNSEVIGWADGDNSTGLLIDIDNDGNYDYAFKTGVGDSISNAIVLGDLNASQEKVIRLKVVVPGDVTAEGIRKFNLKFDYDYTT